MAPPLVSSNVDLDPTSYSLEHFTLYETRAVRFLFILHCGPRKMLEESWSSNVVHLFLSFAGESDSHLVHF